MARPVYFANTAPAAFSAHEVRARPPGCGRWFPGARWYDLLHSEVYLRLLADPADAWAASWR